MEFDSGDNFPSDRIKEITGKTFVATVTKKSALATLTIGRPFTTDDIVYVEAENLYYVVADATSSPILWDIFSEKLTDYVKGAGERNISTKVSTLCSYVTFDNTDNVFVKSNDAVGCRQLGSYINYKGVTVKNPFGLRLFYISVTNFDGTGLLTPCSYNHNRNWFTNARLQEYTLSWHGPDGLATLHNKWQDLREKTDVLKTNIQVNQKILNELATHNMWQINGVVFVPYYNAKTLPLRDAMEIRIIAL